MVPGDHPLDCSVEKQRAKLLLLISNLYLVSKFDFRLDMVSSSVVKVLVIETSIKTHDSVFQSV
jgi:hypothetical protein